MTLNKFWEWFNPDGDVYEVRIRDWKWSKFLHDKYNIPYYSGGVFVRDYAMLMKVVKLVRKHKTAWLSVNPRKRAMNEQGWVGFGGKDINIPKISHIFIDIDRINTKSNAATKSDKVKINKFVDIIIEDLKGVGIDNYCRIDSGNGEQIIIPLDIHIALPILKYDSVEKIYLPNDEFDKTKRVIQQVFINRIIAKYNKNTYKEKYGCEVDKSCGNIGRVMALHGTFNFKFSEPIPRKVTHINNGTNEGLSDGLLNELDNLDLPVYNKQAPKPLLKEFKFKPDTIVTSTFVQFLLKEDIKDNTGVNNTLIFQLKCLIKDNNISMNCSEVIHIKKLLDKKFKRTFAWNTPEKEFHFNPNVVNNYCVENKFIPIYEFWYDKPTVNIYPENYYSWANYNMFDCKSTKKYMSVMDAVYDFSKFFTGTIQEFYTLINEIEQLKGDEYAKWFLENIGELFLGKIIIK